MKMIRSLRQLLTTLLIAGLCQPALAMDDFGVDLNFDAEGGRMAGTLFLPPGDGPFPAVIFLAGSGDESYRTGWESERRSWFWPELQGWFEKRGWAVYIFDKPGVGRSEGDWRREGFDTRKRNALAAVEALSSRAEIKGDRIGLAGHSQGGWIAVMAAAARPEEVAFLITFAGPAIGVRQQIMEDTSNRWACAESRFAGARRAGLGMMLSTVGVIGRVAPAGYLSRIVRYDPAGDLARIEQPMLALFAGNDIMVMPETNLPPLEQHFGRDSDNRRLTVKVIDGLDHFFRKGDFCLGGPRPQNFARDFWPALETPEFWEQLEADNDLIDRVAH